MKGNRPLEAATQEDDKSAGRVAMLGLLVVVGLIAASVGLLIAQPRIVP